MYMVGTKTCITKSSTMLQNTDRSNRRRRALKASIKMKDIFRTLAKTEISSQLQPTQNDYCSLQHWTQATDTQTSPTIALITLEYLHK